MVCHYGCELFDGHGDGDMPGLFGDDFYGRGDGDGPGLVGDGFVGRGDGVVGDGIFGCGALGYYEGSVMLNFTNRTNKGLADQPVLGQPAGNGVIRPRIYSHYLDSWAKFTSISNQDAHRNIQSVQIDRNIVVCVLYV